MYIYICIYYILRYWGFLRLVLYFCSKTIGNSFKRVGCANARLLWINRVEITSDISSQSQVYFKTGDLGNSAIFTRKYLCWSLFSAQVFSCEYCEVLKNNFCHRTPVAAFDLTLLYTLSDVTYTVPAYDAVLLEGSWCICIRSQWFKTWQVKCIRGMICETVQATLREIWLVFSPSSHLLVFNSVLPAAFTLDCSNIIFHRFCIFFNSLPWSDIIFLPWISFLKSIFISYVTILMIFLFWFSMPFAFIFSLSRFLLILSFVLLLFLIDAFTLLG